MNKKSILTSHNSLILYNVAQKPRNCTGRKVRYIMKKEEISYRTKKKLADSLKKFMAVKSFESITVTSLLEDCDITRSTFYYHFEDIYDLMVWMFDEEAVSLMENSRDIDTWSDGILLVYQYVLDNRAVCSCAMNSSSVGRSYLKRFFFRNCHAIMLRFMDSLEIDAQEDHKEFIAGFYTEAIVSSLISWMDSGMRKTPQEMIELYEIAMKGSVRAAMLRSAEQKRKGQGNGM